MCLHLQYIIGFRRFLWVETGQSRAEASDRFPLLFAKAQPTNPNIQYAFISVTV